MFVTVAICTWNRAAQLDQTLTRMRELRIPSGLTWELLIVNNNCTDDTDHVMRSIRHCYRSTGSWRKNRDIQTPELRLAHTRGDLLLWTDDDVLVDPDWLAAYVEAAKAYPDAGYFGGPVEPWFETPPPRWVRGNLDLLQGPFALRELGAGTRPLVGNESPFGANMGFRTSELEGMEFYRRLGRVGTGMLSGDEHP